MSYMSILQELFNSRHTVSWIDIIMYLNHLHQVHQTFSIWNALRSKLITCCILGACINSPWLLQNETHCVSNWYVTEGESNKSILIVFPIGHALRDQLIWTHHRFFMRMADEPLFPNSSHSVWQIDMDASPFLHADVGWTTDFSNSSHTAWQIELDALYYGIDSSMEYRHDSHTTSNQP